MVPSNQTNLNVSNRLCKNTTNLKFVLFQQDQCGLAFCLIFANPIMFQCCVGPMCQIFACTNITQPASQPASQPVSQSASQPASQPSSRPVSQPQQVNVWSLLNTLVMMLGIPCSVFWSAYWIWALGMLQNKFPHPLLRSTRPSKKARDPMTHVGSWGPLHFGYSGYPWVP